MKYKPGGANVKYDVIVVGAGSAGGNPGQPALGKSRYGEEQRVPEDRGLTGRVGQRIPRHARLRGACDGPVVLGGGRGLSKGDATTVEPSNRIRRRFQSTYQGAVNPISL